MLVPRVESVAAAKNHSPPPLIDQNGVQMGPPSAAYRISPARDKLNSDSREKEINSQVKLRNFAKIAGMEDKGRNMTNMSAHQSYDDFREKRS